MSSLLRIAWTGLALTGGIAMANPPKDLTQADLFTSGTDGYHAYRIPALAVTTKGTILAFCEGRKDSLSDRGNIDTMLKRSTDGGKTWDEMHILWDDGENTAGNPCPIVDRDTGTVWLFCSRNAERLFVMKSEDDGVSWSEPRDLTAEVSKPDWSWNVAGPGHGIQLRSGRLLAPCDHRIRGLPRPDSFSHVIYSDDHGATWKLGGSATKKTNECMAVELADGRVCLNMRSFHGKNRRAVAWSSDGGETWSEVHHDDALVTPVCQASILRFTDEKQHDKNRILFANPASTGRNKLTVRLSYDECQTWNAGKVLQEGPAAYSDLCITPDMTICCLYERGEKGPYEKLTFARMSLEWLTDGRDRLPPDPGR